MTSSAWQAIGAMIAAVVVLLSAVGGLGWWLYRRGGRAGKLTSTIETAVVAVKENTSETKVLSGKFAAHQAKTDTLLEEHQRMLVQHDKRLSAVERTSVSVHVNPPGGSGD